MARATLGRHAAQPELGGRGAAGAVVRRRRPAHRPGPPAGADFIREFCGYYERNDGCIVFCPEAPRHPQIDFAKNPVQVAGKFNRWGVDGPAEHPRLAPRVRADGRILWECVAARDRLHAGRDGVPFKFVSTDWQWLGVLFSTPNRFYDAAGNPNYRFSRGGRRILVAANRRGVNLGPIDCGLWVRHG